MDDDIAIVVVEDDRVSRESIENSIGHLSRNISSFADCWSAWMHIKSECTDLVISDVHMSGMNGFDLLRSIKRVFPQIRCIMISGDYSLQTPAMELGADVFLCKPFSTATLIGMIRDLGPAAGRKQ